MENSQQPYTSSYKPYRAKLPVITLLLLAANVIAYLLCVWGEHGGRISVSSFELSARYLSLHGGLLSEAVLDDQQYWQLVTAMFLHVDANHLFNNMLLLGFLGSSLEKELGGYRFLLLYLFCGIAGNITSVFYYHIVGQNIVSIGASGAVFGIVGACLPLLFRKGGFAGIRPVRMILLIAYNLYAGFTQGTINNTAHIAGLICGLLIMLMIIPGLRSADR